VRCTRVSHFAKLKAKIYWGIVINKRSLNKVTLNKVSARQHERRLRRFCSTVAV
jgi:hypothetical protein